MLGKEVLWLQLGVYSLEPPILDLGDDTLGSTPWGVHSEGLLSRATDFAGLFLRVEWGACSTLVFRVVRGVPNKLDSGLL